MSKKKTTTNKQVTGIKKNLIVYVIKHSDNYGFYEYHLLESRVESLGPIKPN